ncbi:pathogenesis-related thaumatin-like protein 3.5 [Typha latifolia]|uniref:pathogenesis-related thaumatin-like protein 3.5 n=1 Tax=Typha latifolia TaxID=4733 RepID=UPI003C2B636E
MDNSPLLLNTFLFLVALCTFPIPASAVTTVFTLRNNCAYTVWPGTLSGNGVALLGGGGFELPPNATSSFPAPPGWSGRFWARTNCHFASSGNGSGTCVTGDCGGELRCTLGGTPPVTLAEFTLASSAAEKDFYDVSLVDGYNIGIGITAAAPTALRARKGEEDSSTSTCGYAGCVGDVNDRCPAELRMAGSGGETVACRSACEAFGTAEYCCTGAHAGPNSCGPTRYSQLFKAVCPTAYSYAYDDPTSTFTCSAGARYLITFCPQPSNPRNHKNP